MANDDRDSGHRPPPQPAWAIDDRAGGACQAEVLQAVERVLTLLHVGSAPPGSAAVAAVNRRFGRHLSPALRATADMMQGCSAAFQYLPFGAATLRQFDVRIRVLAACKAALDAASEALGGELNACRVFAGDYIDVALRTVRSTIENPGAPPDLRRPLLQASQPLQALLSGRLPALPRSPGRERALALPAGGAPRRRRRT